MPSLTLYRRPAAQVMTLALYLCLIGEGLFLFGSGCRLLISQRSCALLHEIAPILVAAGVVGAGISALRFLTLWRPEVVLDDQGIRLPFRGLIPWSEIAGAGLARRRWLPAFMVELKLHDRNGFLRRHWRAARGLAKPLLWFWSNPLGGLLLGRFTRINLFGTGTPAAELVAAIEQGVATRAGAAA